MFLELPSNPKPSNNHSALSLHGRKRYSFPKATTYKRVTIAILAKSPRSINPRPQAKNPRLHDPLSPISPISSTSSKLILSSSTYETELTHNSYPPYLPLAYLPAARIQRPHTNSNRPTLLIPSTRCPSISGKPSILAIVFSSLYSSLNSSRQQIAL